MAEVKNDFKGRYENVECDFCDEQEDQKHILECKALNENNNEKYEKIPEYEEILKNNAKDQIKITRKFINKETNGKNDEPRIKKNWDQVTRISPMSALQLCF